MAPRISLALAIHNHQPVGNFGWVFAEVYEKAYEPLLAALVRHPGVRLALHYTGPLLEWMRDERPDAIEQLRGLVDRGQVELLGGGYYEPVLASLPERDRVGQLVRMADEIEALSGVRPQGAWLAERVWEPDLPTALVAAGYRWTILDDAHFRAAAIHEDALWGSYTTEDQGRLLTVFGTEQGLRYLIPFGELEEVIAHLRKHATEDGTRVGMMGDDGEKFGAWPTTWEHCWGKRQWMERFFRALESNAEWLTTVTPSAWLRQMPPIGRVYVPTGSYAEMGEWALPADESVLFAKTLHEAQEAKRPEARWLRGGFWRNFQVKYREINDLHKQMLRASEKVAEMADGTAKTAALDHLYRGQSNDCYWHGLFGGIYINHMRLATHEHLIAAEDAADAAAREAGRVVDGGFLRDVDMDGIDEAFFVTPGQVVTVKLSEGAGIGEWDIRAVRHALTSVLRRRPEGYHATLVAEEAKRAAAAASAPSTEASVASSASSEASASASTAAASASTAAAERESSVAASPAMVAIAASSAGGAPVSANPGADSLVEPMPDALTADPDGPISIHEIFASKEPGLASRLAYDWHERRSGLVHLLDPATTIEEFAQARYQELGDFVDRPFDVVELTPDRLVAARRGGLFRDTRRTPIRVEKRLSLGGERGSPSLTLEIAVDNESSEPISAMLGVEWNLMMLGGGGNPDAFYEIDGERWTHDSVGPRQAVGEVVSGNTYVGVTLTTQTVPPATVNWFPIDTISNSESGFERVYQGSCLLLTWPLELAPGESLEVRMDQHIQTSRDRATNESR